jgi:cytochrome P450
VHEGDIVETNFRVMLRDKNFWGDDADEFRPDRWETLKPRPTWEFTPFSGGARICPAVNLVYTESAYIVVRFLRRFSALENRDDETDWVEQIRLIFQSKNGAMVGLVE